MNERAEAIRQVAVLLGLDYEKLLSEMPSPGATPMALGDDDIRRLRATPEDSYAPFSTRFTDLDANGERLPRRVWTALKNENILTVGDLFREYPHTSFCYGDQYAPAKNQTGYYTQSRFYGIHRIPNFGKTSYNALMDFLRRLDIPQRMNVEVNDD